MSARIAIVSVALLVASGVALSQPQPKPTPVAPPSPNVPPPLPPPVYSGTVPTPTPREKTVDELLVELEELQAQKARLDKQEADLKATLRKKLEAQSERLKKLGVAAEPAKEKAADKEPDRVGRISIEGNTKTPDSKILKLVDLRPGQVLQYPKLEAARDRLHKAGFRGAAVELIPNELDATFKDIRVKVTETDKR